MGKILSIMQKMANTKPSEEKGVFVMSRETIRKFRKESKSFAGQYMGHKVRMMKSCPDEKIYLMSNDDYAELKYGIAKVNGPKDEAKAEEV